MLEAETQLYLQVHRFIRVDFFSILMTFVFFRNGPKCLGNGQMKLICSYSSAFVPSFRTNASTLLAPGGVEWKTCPHRKLIITYHKRKFSFFLPVILDTYPIFISHHFHNQMIEIGEEIICRSSLLWTPKSLPPNS